MTKVPGAFSLFLSLILFAEAANAAPKLTWTQRSGIRKTMAAETPSNLSSATHMGSDNAGSAFGSTQLTTAAGIAVIDGAMAGNVAVKAAFRLLSSTALYFEPSVEMLFNSNFAGFPVKAGLRQDFALARAPKVTPFAHLSMGPGFSTRGSTVSFTMFVGPGAFLSMGNNLDLRADLGLVMFRDKPGVQLQTGIAL